MQPSIDYHLTLDHVARLALLDFLQASDITPAIALLRAEGSTDHTKFVAAVSLEHLAHDSAYTLCMVDACAITSLVATVSGIATDRLKMADSGDISLYRALNEPIDVGRLLKHRHVNVSLVICRHVHG